MKSYESEKRFDNSASIMDELDVAQRRRPGEEIKRLSIDVPVDGSCPGQGSYHRQDMAGRAFTGEIAG